jgi:1,4-alpha-glucan branching enzyme
MALIDVTFEYLTGLNRPLYSAARLSGTWDAAGRFSSQWTAQPMEAFTAEDGCPAFRATVHLDDSQVGRAFRWGVFLDGPGRTNVWGIAQEINERDSRERYRSFTLAGAGQRERYHLTYCRHLGANKLIVAGQADPAMRFACWAPNARAVDLVFGDRAGGYIWPDGRGETARYPMQQGPDGVWTVDGTTLADLALFTDHGHRPYMFRVTKDDGSIAYRTDLYSRCQIGSGRRNPEADRSWNGTRQDLDGTKSCSVVVDPDRVCEVFRQVDDAGNPVWPETRWLDQEDFWAGEFDPARPVPTRLRDLVIYEMHIDGLGVGRHARGILEDAIDLLDHLVDLGINCVELMPFSEYEGWASWGYGTSHYLALEYAGGGRDQFKHFVRDCHRRGIAVIMDVVYNHYSPDADRAEWAYDSNAHERNIYYWYEGRPSDYPGYEEAARRNPAQTPAGHGGYIDNMSTGYAPRFSDESVRRMFCSSAAALVAEFHIDGFRVDQTTSIHSYAVLHANGQAADSARIFGAKFLREWTNTVNLVNPDAFLIAEDHSGWFAVTQPTDNGGLGFDATWYADYYHHLIGDASNDPSRARLLTIAGYGGDGALNMTAFAYGPLVYSADNHIHYHESHDEAGNSSYEAGGQRIRSARTIVTAVNGANLSGETRRYAEARTRVIAGLTFTAPGVPMFFMGEEVGASEPYRFDDFLAHREDFPAMRQGVGATLFRFYQAGIALRKVHPGLKSTNIDVIHVHDANRLIAFRRWDGAEEFLVVASLNNVGFGGGYRIQSPRLGDGAWREVLNSDSAAFGGSDMRNGGTVMSAGGSFTARVPMNSILVFQRQ